MEVASFVQNVSQFEGPNSGMCVAYAAAQIIRMVAPDQSNPSSVGDINQLAEQLYRNMTGQIAQPLPVTVQQLRDVLSSFGIHYDDHIDLKIDTIDAALASGCPVIVQAPESSFRDLRTGGGSPYRWDTTPFNHCIILSGLSGDGGYEVRDSANFSGNPAVYQKHIDRPFSTIQVLPTWIGDNIQMKIYGPGKGDFDNWFICNDNDHWTCKQTGVVLQFGNLGLYRQLSIDGNSLPVVGLPLEAEQYHTADGYSYSTQRCERATIVYDPEHKLDSQPGMGTSYLAHVNSL